MKRLIIILILLHLSSYVFTQTATYDDTKKILREFVDSFYNHYYGFPMTFETMVSAMESRKNHIESSLICQYNDALDFLKNNKKTINWLITEQDCINKELVVLFQEDTLIHKYDQNPFPCLGLLLDEYRFYYLEDPETLDDFLRYKKHRKQFDEPPFIGCDSTTFAEILECGEQTLLIWKKDETDLLIKVNNDTIVFTPTFSVCGLEPFEKRLVRFYDVNNGIIISKELDSIFHKGILQIKKDYPIIDKGKEMDYNLFKYTSKKGLLPLCFGIDNLEYDAAWLEEIEKYLHSFTIEHRIESLVFGLLSCHK